jgi:ABC-type antimicrobial peptide transport system permease subunit
VVLTLALGIGATTAPFSVGRGVLLRALLYEVSATNPLTFGAVAALLGLVALAASYLPAWRAARLDPRVALRAE